MAQLQASSGDTVVAFRPGGHGSRTRSDAPGEERGRLLLFTGVRYERLGAPDGRTDTKSPALTAADEPGR
jgi:hypothetical protein